MEQDHAATLGEPDTTHRLIVDDPIISLSGRFPGTVGDSVQDI
jgi:hypothetical protein